MYYFQLENKMLQGIQDWPREGVDCRHCLLHFYTCYALLVIIVQIGHGFRGLMQALEPSKEIERSQELPSMNIDLAR